MQLCTKLCRADLEKDGGCNHITVNDPSIHTLPTPLSPPISCSSAYNLLHLALLVVWPSRCSFAVPLLPMRLLSLSAFVATHKHAGFVCRRLQQVGAAIYTHMDQSRGGVNIDIYIHCTRYLLSRVQLSEAEKWQRPSTHLRTPMTISPQVPTVTIY